MRPEKQTLENAACGRRALLTLVIPTRNEVDNLSRLVRELRESLTGVDCRVVFVDDSTDGTPQVIRSISEEDGRIF
jgi:dolichol-phosphate mannosyltransferase